MSEDFHSTTLRRSLVKIKREVLPSIALLCVAFLYALCAHWQLTNELRETRQALAETQIQLEEVIQDARTA